jgi:hypothetical protein
MSRPGLFVQYIVHAIVASYGLMILGEVVEYIVGLPFGSQNRWVDYYFIGPTFLFPISAGMIAGYILGDSLPKASSRLLLLLPLAMMSWDLSAFLNSNYDVTLHNFINTYLGKNCTSSECLGEAWVTSPLISAIAYSLGAEGRRFKTYLAARRRNAGRLLPK